MSIFDVLTQPWIPVETQEGKVEELGLLAVLEKAHHLRSLADPAPPIQFGLYRMLIAFVMDALRMHGLDELEDLLGSERFDTAALGAYAEAVGWDRFDLFAPQRPFLQAGPTPEDADREKSVAELFFHLPSGSYVTHFFHVRASEQALAPAVCARGLCAVPPFMTAGGAGYSPSINGAPPWYVLIRGRNLFETIVLNCYVADDLGLEPEGVPAWRTDEPIVPRKEADCRSLLTGLTWRSRQIRLLPGESGVCTYSGRSSPILVRRMVFGPGLKFRGDTWTDPQVAYMASAEGRQPLRPREDRALWRDTGPLLLLRSKDYESEKGRVRFSRPLVVDQFRRLGVRGMLWTDGDEPEERVEVYGMRTDKAKVFEWQYERLAVLEKVAENPYSGLLVQQAMDQGDAVAYGLRSALKRAYPREGKGNKGALERLVQAAQHAYWSALRERFERQFLSALAVQDPGDAGSRTELARRWKRILREEGWKALNAVLEPLDTDAEALARQVSVRAAFAAALTRHLDPQPSGKPKQERGKGA